MDEYIKKETVLSIYRKWIPQLESKEDEGDKRGVETCIAVLEDLPAADVAPVVHGHWNEDRSGIIICSKCRRGYNLVARYTNYCPNCGARMDGDC